MWYCPVYLKDGNEIIVASTDFIGKDHDEAYMIALGSMLVECILLDMEFLRIVELDPKNTPHVRAMLYPSHGIPIPVIIIAGPEFEKEKELFASRKQED